MGTKFNRSTPTEKPPPGLHHAVCVDVVMLGVKDTKSGPKPKVALAFMLDPTLKNAKGYPFIVRRSYTSTLHPKSSLSIDICTWFNLSELSERQITGFSQDGGPDKLLGVNCQLQIVHAPADDGGVWANIKTILPAPPNAAKLSVPSDFVRQQDKPDESGSENVTGEEYHGNQAADDAESLCPF